MLQFLKATNQLIGYFLHILKADVLDGGKSFMGVMGCSVEVQNIEIIVMNTSTIGGIFTGK